MIRESLRREIIYAKRCCVAASIRFDYVPPRVIRADVDAAHEELNALLDLVPRFPEYEGV